MTAVFLVSLLWAAASAAQICSARIETRPDSRWSSVTPGSDSAAPLATMAHLRCTGCQPEISLLLTAGTASPALQNMPIGRKVGEEWARAVFDDPAAREGFRQSVLRSELRSSPGCSVRGSVNGVERIGNLGAVATAIEADCSNGTKLLGEIYSAYDFNCEYQVQVVWPAGRLSPESRAEVGALLRGVRFGQ
jgi:hypothetical protein